MAAPAAAPAIIASASGVSRTRLSPYLAHRPSVAPKTPPLRPTSSPRIMTRSSRSISSSMAERIASRMFISAMSVPLAGARRTGLGCVGSLRRATAGDRSRVDALVRIGDRRIRPRLRALRGLVDLGLDLGPQPLVRLVAEDAQLAQLTGEGGDRVPLLERLDLGGVAVAPLVVIRRVAGGPDGARPDERGAPAPPRAVRRL